MKIKILGVVILLTLIFPMAIYAHAFYMSTCLIRHRPETRMVEVELRMFPDDLELALVERGAPALGLMGDNPNPNSGEWIYPYVLEKFSLTIDGKRIPLWLESWEKYEDVIKVVLAQEDICDIREVKVRNEVLIEIYDEQANIVKVKVGNRSETMNLNKMVGEGAVSF